MKYHENEANVNKLYPALSFTGTVNSNKVVTMKHIVNNNSLLYGRLLVDDEIHPLLPVRMKRLPSIYSVRRQCLHKHTLVPV